MTTQPTTPAVPPSNVINTAANAAPPQITLPSTPATVPDEDPDAATYKRIDALEGLADLAGTAAQLAVETAVLQLRSGQAKDPAGMARNLAVVKGVALDKRSKLIEEAPARTRTHKDPRASVRAIALKIGLIYDNATDELRTPNPITPTPELPPVSSSSAPQSGAELPAPEPERGGTPDAIHPDTQDPNQRWR